MPSFYIETRGNDIILHNKYGVYSKLELEGQFREGHLTVKELGTLYSLSYSQIQHVLNSLGISYRNSLFDTRVPDFSINPSMHQVILGTMLGDAYMPNKRMYCVNHSVNQMDYLYHVAEKLGSLVSSVSYKDGKFGKSLSLWTSRCHFLEPYYQKFYSGTRGKKRIDPSFIQDLEAEGLAYWYMDDGKFKEYGFYLCTGNFSVSEIIKLIELLDVKFSIKSTLQNQDKTNDYNYIYIRAESRDKFISLVEPYIIPSMRYKLEGSPYPKLDNELLIASRHIEFCKRVDRPVNFSGNTMIEEIISKDTIINKKKIFMESVRKRIEERKQVSFTNIRKEPSEEELRSLLDQGLTDAEIASRYGFGRNRISRMRRALNISGKRVRNKIDRTRFPCLNVKLVETKKVESNDYNPNKVAHPEMELLIHSIAEDGLTQPIVVFYDSERDKYIVIDGFHRYVVLRDHFKYEKIPVVVLDKQLKDRMASTIRHNRARGRHQVDLMGVLVKNLSDLGWSDAEIARHLGMEGEELMRLRQQVGCACFLAGSEYNKAWDIK